ncbi:hypothetical protein HK100_008839 [Physocladia obscura]|uniref:Uncharacterized protein n=1 Tax=Physocladia obscura TaxID=109957 RepID=A0AAD5X7L4_9FUNG|nr:hypothetical protein HK100_008839 [Physocladia obscura]
MESNYFGYVNIALAAIPHLQKSDTASLTVVGSLAGRVGSPFVHAYSASKFAIDGFFNCLRHELAFQKENKIVITNCVLGAIGTQNFFDTVSVHSESVLKIAVSPEDTARRILEGIVGREKQFYFPAFIQAQYVINSISPALGYKILRIAHNLSDRTA